MSRSASRSKSTPALKVKSRKSPACTTRLSAPARAEGDDARRRRRLELNF